MIPRLSRQGLWITAIACALFQISSCDRVTPDAAGPLLQRGYVWQREWTPATAESVAEAQSKMDGVVVLGAEIVWNGKTPDVIKSSIDWAVLITAAKPCAIALRIAPYPGPFSADDASIRFIGMVVKSLLDEAVAHGVTLGEFQLDFDCAQARLAGYRSWLRALRPLVQPARLVITTLPAWLHEPEFVLLLKEVDGSVLQVHSVPTTRETGRSALCDSRLARKWVAAAAKLGRPFAVALPTYRCVAGYDEAGKLSGVAMDSVQPTWPQGTRILEFAADPDEIAMLVHEWRNERPRGLREILWYRVPIKTDTRNWRWPTLAAVMSGRKPARKLEVLHEGENPVDLSVLNAGEADELLDAVVTISWTTGSVATADALPGWSVVIEKERAIFTATANSRIRLSPGASCNIGWLRFDRTPNLQFHVAKQTQPAG